MILTHFSQRYQKIPSLSALDHRSIKLEDAEDIDDPSADMEEPIEESTIPRATIDTSSEGLEEKSSQTQPEPQAQDVNAPVVPSASTTSALAQIIASNINPTPSPLLNDMRIGVAFDHMRVKVGDIMHLDRFTPAMMELYKDPEDGAANEKAAKEAFSDDENDILQMQQESRVKGSEKRSQEEKAERIRKGQMKAARRQEGSSKIKVTEKKEDKEDGKGKAGEGIMEVVETTEPVMEKMEAVQ